MICSECPRACAALRTESAAEGACRSPAVVRLARAALHFWEEPCISGTRGSGAMFFSGCPLRCVFCQNYIISHEGLGKTVDVPRLRRIMDELRTQGAHNINLVSPTHYAHALLEVFDGYRPGIPIVYNCSGYESVQTLRALSGIVDIYLTDLKYFGTAPAKKYSGAEDYFAVASRAVLEMSAQKPECVMDADGIMRSGLIIRHLVLPGNTLDTLRVLDWCAEHIGQRALYSIMSQFTPTEHTQGIKPLDRRLTPAEYARVERYTRELGLHGYIQELSSAKEEYTPPFDFTGV